MSIVSILCNYNCWKVNWFPPWRRQKLRRLTALNGAARGHSWRAAAFPDNMSRFNLISIGYESASLVGVILTNQRICNTTYYEIQSIPTIGKKLLTSLFFVPVHHVVAHYNVKSSLSWNNSTDVGRYDILSCSFLRTMIVGIRLINYFYKPWNFFLKTIVSEPSPEVCKTIEY